MPINHFSNPTAIRPKNREPGVMLRSIPSLRAHSGKTPDSQEGKVGTPAVFIDKDGTLVENVPYNVNPDFLIFTPGAMQALRLLSQAGMQLVIVSNQPGLATGRFSPREFARLKRILTQRLREEGGIELAGFYVCPHAPEAQTGLSCLCRKPAPGLLHQAASACGIDLSRSWMIGDILDDVEAGRRAGCRTILLDVGNETCWRLSSLRIPHFLCEDLFEAAQIITSNQPAPRPSVGERRLSGERLL